MRHVDTHVQLDRLTSLAKVLCHSIIIMHSPLGKQMLVEARERKWWIQNGSPLWVHVGNFVEAAIDFGWVCVTFQEHLHLKSVVTHPTLSGQRIFPKMLNTCSTGAEEAASAIDFLASLESAWNCASVVF